MPDKVTDLDALRPPKNLVKIGGEEIDVSFIPCGITFEAEELSQQIFKMDPKAVQAGGKQTKIAFDLTIKLCSLFCSCKHPELDETWFRQNCDPIQLGKLSEKIIESLSKSYEAVDEHKKK